jgi:hypothetical protein
MAVEPIAARHAEHQVSLARRTSREMARLWRQVDRDRIAASWRALLPQALVMLSTSQMAAAAAAAGLYVDDVLEDYAMSTEAAGRIVPGAFGGIASDGRPLASCSTSRPSPRSSRSEPAHPRPGPCRAGGFTLDLIGRTQVIDAGRVADGVAIAARPQLAGYVRVIVGKTCARCLILAGKRYRWNAGFKRHPRCDCRHVPIAELRDGEVTNPRAHFDSLSRHDQDELLGAAGAAAVREGADLNQVVNARRGMQTAAVFGRQVQVTTEGTTTRGLAGQRLGARATQTKATSDRYRRAANVRLMPEQIMHDARDREDAIRLLRLHGYIT